MSDTILSALVATRYAVARTVWRELKNVHAAVLGAGDQAMAILLSDPSVIPPTGKLKAKPEQGVEDVPARSWTWYNDDKSWHVYLWLEPVVADDGLGACLLLQARGTPEARTQLAGNNLPQPVQRGEWISEGEISSVVRLSAGDTGELAKQLGPAMGAYLAFAREVDAALAPRDADDSGT